MRTMPNMKIRTNCHEHRSGYCILLDKRVCAIDDAVYDPETDITNYFDEIPENCPLPNNYVNGVHQLEIEKSKVKLLKIAKAIAHKYQMVPESYSFNVNIEIGEPVFESEIIEAIKKYGGKFEDQL